MVTWRGVQYRVVSIDGENVNVIGPDGTNRVFQASQVKIEGLPISADPVTTPLLEIQGHRCAECGRKGHLVRDLEDGLWKHLNCCDIPPA